MRNTLVCCGAVAFMVVSVAGCKKKSPPPTPATTMTPASNMGGMMMGAGSGETCQEARPTAIGATTQGDLTTARDDFNARVEVTGYSWRGRDQFYYVDLAAGQTVTLALDDRGGFDGGLYVFRDCNNIVATVVAGKDTNASTPLSFTAPAMGRYFIAVDSWQPNTGGAYALTITPGAAAGAMPAMPMAGGGETCASPIPIAMGGTVQGDLTNAHDDFNARVEVTGYSWQGKDQFYYVDLAAGQTVTLRLDDHGGFDGGLYVFRDCSNVAGTIVAGKDTNASSPLTFTAPAMGRYFIAVDSWQPNTGGAYALTLTPGGA